MACMPHQFMRIHKIGRRTPTCLRGVQVTFSNNGMVGVFISKDIIGDPAGMTKFEIREIVKRRLAAMTPGEYSGFNCTIQKYFWELERVRQANSVMIYYSIGAEVETISIIQKLISMGKIVSLPVCNPSQSLIAGLITDIDQLITTRYGLKEPDPSRLICPESIELIVVPGLAFDELGFRMGRGAGYYDRFLSEQPNSFKLGLAYDFQVLPGIPVESHDIRMDGLITPSGYKEF